MGSLLFCLFVLLSVFLFSLLFVISTHKKNIGKYSPARTIGILWSFFWVGWFQCCCLAHDFERNLQFWFSVFPFGLTEISMQFLEWFSTFTKPPVLETSRKHWGSFQFTTKFGSIYLHCTQLKVNIICSRNFAKVVHNTQDKRLCINGHVQLMETNSLPQK
jgi:hypothetical protein